MQILFVKKLSLLNSFFNGKVLGSWYFLNLGKVPNVVAALITDLEIKCHYLSSKASHIFMSRKMKYGKHANSVKIMTENTGQIDLNADAVLFDRENDVVGIKPSKSNADSSVGVSCSGNLSDDPGAVVVPDQEPFQVGDDDSVLYGLNHGCDVIISGNGEEGFGEELGLVDVGVVGKDCDGKERDVVCGMEKHEDEKSGIGFSDGVMLDYGGPEPEPNEGLIIEFNDDFRGENAIGVIENGLLSTEVAVNNVAQGGDNGASGKNEDAMDVSENAMNFSVNDRLGMEVVANNVAQGCDNDAAEKIENAALVNLSALVEGDNERNLVDSLVDKDGLKSTAEIATYQLQNVIPCIEAVNVNAEESLHVKDLLRNCLEPALQVDAPVKVMHNQNMVADVVEKRVFENNQNMVADVVGGNLVVDLNSCTNMQEVGMNQGSVFSEWNLCLSDLVWGKVTGHPWWPGQIFDASAASDKAKRHLKKDCYLVAYFGDQTFAWTDVSMIKPFLAHFSQMEKQSNLKNFHHAVNCALDEVSRLVEFDLSCPCIPDDVYFKLKTQIISNAGINNQLSRRNGVEKSINSMSFEPMKLVNYVKSLAQSPLRASDRLDSVIAQAQLSSFYRSKGYFQLAEFKVLGGLFENDMQTLTEREIEQFDYQTCVGHSLQEYKSNSGYKKRHGKKHKLMSDLMSERRLFISNDEHAPEHEAKPVPRRRGRKRKTASKTSENCFPNSQNEKIYQIQHASISEMKSQLCLAARNPTGESFSSDMVQFFAEFRNSISLLSASLDKKMFLQQMHDVETEATSMVGLPSMTSTMEPCIDSYWTDRIIQSIPGKQSTTKYQNERVIFLPETLTDASPVSFKLLPSAEITTTLGFNQQDTNEILESESSKPKPAAEHLDESSTQGFCPTALTLKFSNFDSVPSTTDLNKIFGRFGPLIQSKTELLERTNRARVVFLRRSDAETAFSSAGKYSIFGPSLVSYRLKILPRKPQKVTGKRGRKKRRVTNSVDGAAV
ncbi:unnamed protein product [Sphenostylis stenocarpa]|uniref:PWWP domain-containing protein n=1 Tax=Sphenostylis stenocarpa TaxID=92480 RepID=A0AA86SS40_9FABA|nr:unnamed protein product [Sphenostylis stenocarpa]